MTNMDEYITKLRSLENYLHFGMDVSEQTKGRQNVPWKLARAHQLYNRMTVSCMSFVHLLPMNLPFKTKAEFWDFFSVASLTRNILENYLTLFYIGVDNVSKEESDFRLAIFQFHLNSEKFRLYQEFGESVENLKDFAENLPRDKEKIRTNTYFNSINKAKAASILKGNDFMYLTKHEIFAKIPFKTDEFTPMYRLLSNHTHSTPFAFYTQSNERGRGLENATEVAYITMCIDLVTKYLLAAILDVIAMFPDCEAGLHPQKVKIVREEFEKLRQ